MAGQGKRFYNYGYKAPKHLIQINNKPMFERAAMTFSKNIKWIFISQKKFMNNFVFKKSLKGFKNKKNIFLSSHTSGQASTVKKAINYLNDKNKIIIHSCDLTFNVNMEEVNNKIKKFDVIIFTAKSIRGTKYNNRVLVGSFIFKNKKVLDDCIKYIFKRKIKINNEYYMDNAASISNKIGYKLGEVIVDKYISWGSHYELLEYK